MSTVGLSERDSKETLFVKEEVTNDTEVFGEVEVDVEGSQKGLEFLYRSRKTIPIWRLGCRIGTSYP